MSKRRDSSTAETPTDAGSVVLAEEQLDQVTGSQSLLLPAVQKVAGAADKVHTDEIPDTYSVSLNFAEI